MSLIIWQTKVIEIPICWHVNKRDPYPDMGITFYLLNRSKHVCDSVLTGLFGEKHLPLSRDQIWCIWVKIPEYAFLFAFPFCSSSSCAPGRQRPVINYYLTLTSTDKWKANLKHKHYNWIINRGRILVEILVKMRASHKGPPKEQNTELSLAL